MNRWSLGLPAACAGLTLFVCVAFTVVGYFAFDKFGETGVQAAGVAAGVCWVSATAALVVTSFAEVSPKGVPGILVACGLRFGLPLVAGILVQGRGGQLAEAGFMNWIVVFYLITLVLETSLSVLVHRDGNPRNGKGTVTNG